MNLDTMTNKSNHFYHLTKPNRQMDALKLTELHRLVRMSFAQDPENTRESADCSARRGLKIALGSITGDRIRTAKYVGVKP
jgi:hypothetical protein